MKIFKNKDTLQKEIANINNISFVPTMGGLHKGHISLIKRSKKFKGKTLVSIFVNPKQFNKKNDFINYPRNLKRDLDILKRFKVNYVFLPTTKEIFSYSVKNKIFLHKFSKKLCGKFRKGHFEGVLNIVNRFLEIINPKYIFLGQKDYQQCYLINHHILKNNIKTKIVHCKTVREINGIACSTRNNNLDKTEIKIASKVFKYLKNKKRLLKKNINNFNLFHFKTDIINLGVNKIDYLKIYNLKNLSKPKSKKDKFKIFIAYYLNKTRLIDNI